MPWSQWYTLRSYTRSSLWIVPFISLLLYVGIIRVAYSIGNWITWEPLVGGWSASGTRSILETIVTLTLTFIVFTFGSLLVAIQVAGGQLTPRIIATTLLRDNSIRFTVGLFTFTLLFAAGVLARLETNQTPASSSSLEFLGFCSIAAFLYLIDYAARLLRPVSIIWRVGEQGRAVIEEVYPGFAQERGPRQTTAPEASPPPDRIIEHQGKAAIVLAVNVKALIAEARQNRTQSSNWHPRVGDFLASGEAIFRLYGDTGLVDDRRLQRDWSHSVLSAPSSRISTFAFRIIVDIAIKALSKAINDPTTAVLAIDQLQRLLGWSGSVISTTDIPDSSGQLRVVFHTPNWEDFVQVLSARYGCTVRRTSRSQGACVP